MLATLTIAVLSFTCATVAAEGPFAGAFWRLGSARTGRVSSWDRTGGNRDSLSFRAGETKELVRLGGPVAITRLYMTSAAEPRIEIVVEGAAVATVVVDPGSSGAQRRRTRGFKTDDQTAAAVLVQWVRKMTGVELPVAASAPASGTVIFVGAAARAAGLDLGGIDSPGKEGLRILTDGNRILIGGQSGAATVKAVCRFLEELGCRYFMEGPLGEVYPRVRSLGVGPLAITERPGFLYRSIWGSTWSGNTLWKVWNGAGGPRLGTGHSWSSYVPRGLYDEHPEYFRQDAEGRRVSSQWLCTSNEEVRELFARNVVKAVRAGTQHPSVSPPDGTSYCQCPACRAQDDPSAVEPSSGRVSVTNRFVDFLSNVAERVGRAVPESILGFYAYADYTQPPTRPVRLPENVCVWIAPIRYCRLHCIGDEHCPSRQQLVDVLEGWSRAAATRTPNRLVTVLPDRWRLAYDLEDKGVSKGYQAAGFDDSRWRDVATFSRTLDAQGLPDRKTIMWYRCRFTCPEPRGKPALFFTEVDGTPSVYVNGTLVGEGFKKRQPFQVDVTSAVRPGANVVAVRVDHSRITELFLGGIVRPVLLVEK